MDSDMADEVVYQDNSVQSYQYDAEGHFHMASQSQAPYRPAVPNQIPVGKWSTGLCSCFNDVSSCFITSVCPCITFGQNAEIIDRGKTSCVNAGRNCFFVASISGLCCFYTCTYRTKLRGFYSLPGNQFKDCFLHLCCTLCAICQEYRELKNRGCDPSLGWHVHVEKQSQRGSMVAPTVATGMTR